jgi:hypothetical protein
VKRCAHGFRSFEHHRLRVLLHAGGVTWPTRPVATPHPNPRSPIGPDFGALRPVFHCTEQRVRGHIAICVIAAVVEALITAQLRAADVRDPDLDDQHLCLAALGVDTHPWDAPNSTETARNTRRVGETLSSRVPPTSPYARPPPKSGQTRRARIAMGAVPRPAPPPSLRAIELRLTADDRVPVIGRYWRGDGVVQRRHLVQPPVIDELLLRHLGRRVRRVGGVRRVVGLFR